MVGCTLHDVVVAAIATSSAPTPTEVMFENTEKLLLGPDAPRDDAIADTEISIPVTGVAGCRGTVITDIAAPAITATVAAENRTGLT